MTTGIDWATEPLARVCGQLIVGGFAGHDLPPELGRALSSGTRAGVILFRRNLGSLEQIRGLCQSIHQLSTRLPAWVGIDQEGGRVSRLGPPVVQLPPMRALGAARDETLVGRAARQLGLELGSLGITVDFAPVLDVDTNRDNPVIGDRSFSSDPETVARLGGDFARGLAGAGVLPCGKHFPGHGDTSLDSHVALPVVDHSAARLHRIELTPFRRLSQTVPALMTAHVLYPHLDPYHPATLSPAIATDLLRHELGFRGVLFSDDLEMGALEGTIEDRAIGSVRAGCEVLLICQSWDLQERAHQALVRTAEQEPEFRRRCIEAVLRSERVRSSLATHPAERLNDDSAFSGPARRKLDAELAALG